MRRSVTEEFYDNCPNCGAAVQADFRNCPYCGTSLIFKRTTETDDGNPGDLRRVDIVSKAGGGNGELSENSRGILMIAVIIFAISFIMPFLVVFTVPAFIALVFIVIIGGMAEESGKRQSVLRGSPRYKALVLDQCLYNEVVGTGRNRHTVTRARLKVLTHINGRETCILINAGTPTAAARYPEGTYVTIAGYGDYYILVS